MSLLENYNGPKYLILLGPEKYDVIFENFIVLKNGIYVFLA